MRPFGKRALITGASRGIGFAYAEALVKQGCRVVINHHNDGEQAERSVRLLSAHGGAAASIEADVGNADSARKLVADAAQHLGGLDILVNNAGICRFTPFLDLTSESWDRHMSVNFAAGFHLGQAAARVMVKQGTGGRMVYTTSPGAVRSNATQVHYCASKGGLELLARGMAIELAPHGITVNCVAPGWIHTAINDADSRNPAVLDPWLAAHCPVGRVGIPADLESTLLFLCSADSGYVNGTTVFVDGGWNAQL